jgi:transcription elongation GreA/GreB family factor
MAAIEIIKSLISEGRFDEIDDIWITQQAGRPDDLAFFVETARLLTAAKEAERVEFLLELLDEQLRERQRWDSRLELLKQTGLAFLDPIQIHAAIMESLENLYAGCPSLEGLVDRVGLHRAIEDTPKLWIKVERLRSLMQFESGVYVWMKDKGPGRIVEVNLELESFKLQIAGLPDLRVGFAAAAKMLSPLPPDHIERRKLEDLDSLLALKRDQPGELLLIALQSHPQALTAAEIRKALSGIVEDAEWKSWWSEARRHPRVLTTRAKGRQTYGWAASEDHALEEVRERFRDAGVDEKLAILRKDAKRSAALKEEMIRDLQGLAESHLADQPSAALKIWFALDKLGATSELTWSPSTLIAESSEPAALAATLADKSIRERFYALCREDRADWPEIFQQSLALEEDPKLLSSLADQLGAEDSDQLKTAIDDILGHSKRRPAAFVWLAESGDSLPSLAERNPLRLIRQILDALHQSEFSAYKGRLHNTFETGGGATPLFTRLSEEQAAQAEEAIRRASIDEHLQDTLIRYLHVRYPALDTSREAPLYATEAAIAKCRREITKLQEEEIPANRRAIEEARELGDLRENFEYKSARQRHEYLNARLAKLNNDLSRVRPLLLEQLDLSEARIGCRLDLKSADGSTSSITILGPWESDPDRQIVSYDSELGQDLLGKRVGEAVTIDGDEMTISGIVPWE